MKEYLKQDIRNTIYECVSLLTPEDMCTISGIRAYANKITNGQYPSMKITKGFKSERETFGVVLSDYSRQRIVDFLVELDKIIQQE